MSRAPSSMYRVGCELRRELPLSRHLRAARKRARAHTCQSDDRNKTGCPGRTCLEPSSRQTSNGNNAPRGDAGLPKMHCTGSAGEQ
jgi:hypothetical protein